MNHPTLPRSGWADPSEVVAGSWGRPLLRDLIGALFSVVVTAIALEVGLHLTGSGFSGRSGRCCWVWVPASW